MDTGAILTPMIIKSGSLPAPGRLRPLAATIVAAVASSTMRVLPQLVNADGHATEEPGQPERPHAGGCGGRVPARQQVWIGRARPAPVPVGKVDTFTWDSGNCRTW